MYAANGFVAIRCQIFGVDYRRAVQPNPASPAADAVSAPTHGSWMVGDCVCEKMNPLKWDLKACVNISV